MFKSLKNPSQKYHYIMHKRWNKKLSKAPYYSKKREEAHTKSNYHNVVAILQMKKNRKLSSKERKEVFNSCIKVTEEWKKMINPTFEDHKRYVAFQNNEIKRLGVDFK